jgi:acetyl-CoA/propionyl-CoA carboxylase biotin carboxyl carrier protein
VIDSVLIANRGEIAVRIIRAAGELGMRTIAVYSELDRDALHVELADEAWNIGPAPAAESYLNGDRIIEVAKEARAVAVHPGYGFLAENAGFAAAVLEAGLVWIGPPPEAIAVMGDKIRSRTAVNEADVRGVLGALEPLTSADQARSLADEFGLPIAIKAAHGGGGRGLRVIRDASEIDAGFDAAAREADAYFGSPEVYVEKYLESARHVEAQVLFDTHGNGAFVGERDCSVQRRYQKLIEEAPAFSFSDKQRRALAKAALAVGKAAGYVGAGTVEFLVDAGGDFYFLEMNTRLQVEHPVTEMTTGIDLVREQFRIASGEELGYRDPPPVNGHAIEFRINAEDPANNFMPDPGRVAEYHEPGGFGVRVDGWVRVGTKVSQYYDNLLAKLIVWGRDRDEAIERGRRALNEFAITGLSTTIGAHLRILDSQGFREGRHHTKFVEEDLDFSDVVQPTSPALPEDEELSERRLTVEVGGRHYDVRLWAPNLTAAPDQGPGPRLRPPKLERRAQAGDEDGVVTAPMQGTIVKVSKKAGDRVRSGETLCVLEAMKMENEIKAPLEGEIVDLRIQPGDAVAAGQVVAVIK